MAVSSNDFSSFNIWFSYRIVFKNCSLSHCVLHSTFLPVNMKFFMFMCEGCVKVYEIKINTGNLLFVVEICSLCRKETLFQVEFQQCKWK